MKKDVLRIISISPPCHHFRVLYPLPMLATSLCMRVEAVATPVVGVYSVLLCGVPIPSRIPTLVH